MMPKLVSQNFVFFTRVVINVKWERKLVNYNCFQEPISELCHGMFDSMFQNRDIFYPSVT